VAGAVPAVADPLQLQAQYHNQPISHRATPAYIAPGGAPVAASQRTAATSAPVRYARAESDVNLGGGFIEFLFGNGRPLRPPANVMVHAMPHDPQPPAVEAPARAELDPKYDRQVVPYHGSEKPGTIVIDTPNRFLYLVQDGGTAVRYGIGVGKPGFTWAGVKTVSAKKEWPDWVPPPEMLQRRPDLPAWMAGGPENPLGARALYLGSSLYRIHGSNEPWTIGQAVSSGCIRMRNEDVVDLYNRVKIGTRVVVI
jgi:lipoprotein-anchoring transpeptidase ErfK/SrfK